MKTLLLTALPLGLMLGFAPSVRASTYTYNFDNPTGTLGTSQTYTVNGVTITAYGYNNGVAAKLFGKQDGGDENGLGLYGTSDHEITTTGFVQLDLANLWALNPITVTMSIGSVQHDESWDIFGSNTKGSKGTELLTGSLDAPNTFNLAVGIENYRYVSVQADCGDVLLSTLSAGTSTGSQTPEPGTMVLLGTGLLGMSAMLRRIRRA